MELPTEFYTSRATARARPGADRRAVPLSPRSRMSRFFKAVKAGVRGALSLSGPSRFRAAGLPLTCQHCQTDTFRRRDAQLNTAGASAMDLDWLNRTGTALVCTNCGLIHWFIKDPERVEE